MNTRFVESSVVIAKPPGLVLNAFTDMNHLKNWWGVERSFIDLKRGGLYSLVWKITDDAIGFVTTGIVGEYLPACQLKIESLVYFNPRRPIFGPMELLVLTTPEEIGTTLTVVQSGYKNGPDWDWYYNVVKEAWPAVVLKIKDYLERIDD
jgi:uncharacterized protein YndB with AHSA1/START domain